MDIWKKFYDQNKKQAIGSILLVILILILVIASAVSCSKREKQNTKEAESTGTTVTQEESSSLDSVEETSVLETEPVLTWQPESADSELVSLISSFYQAYILSGDINEVAKYMDSTEGMNEQRLSINKKYIENVSDFDCYKTDLDIVDDSYTILAVTYKVKLYNYEELLPSIDILFLVNGESGYRVHNLTVSDAFDRQKIQNDNNFQILSAAVSEELHALLAANADLNQVYQLYLNPASE